jgi:hypothetical protein
MRVRVRPQLRDLVEDGWEPALTPGDEHVVLGISQGSYRIIDDRGEPALFPKPLFVVMDAAIPPGWSFDEGDDGAYYLEPAETIRPGFYEDFFGSDGDRAAQREAQETVRSLLAQMIE